MTEDALGNDPVGPGAAVRDGVRDVVLVHGLWMPGAVMAPLASRLRRRGYRTHVFAYRGRKGSLESHGDALGRFVEKVANGAPVHFVAHSMGGLIVLAAFRGAHAPATGKVVLLGTPACGCMSACRLASAAPGRWMLGESQALWPEHASPVWVDPAPLGVIAGGTPSFGLGRLLGALPGVNDGVVRLDETGVNGMTDRIVVPVGHTQLIFTARVEALTAQFLARGSFKR